MSGHDSKQLADPCAVDDRYQRQAYVWFFCVAIISTVAVYYLSSIDRWMYDTNGHYLDYDKYRENRRASTSLASERVDERRAGDFESAVEHARP